MLLVRGGMSARFFFPSIVTFVVIFFCRLVAYSPAHQSILNTNLVSTGPSGVVYSTGVATVAIFG